jgi:hypothetical protein
MRGADFSCTTCMFEQDMGWVMEAAALLCWISYTLHTPTSQILRNSSYRVVFGEPHVDSEAATLSGYICV